jgi:hypothetical protein
MSKGPVLEIQFPADIDWQSWIERCDNIHEYFGREKNESCRCPGS